MPDPVLSEAFQRLFRVGAEDPAGLEMHEGRRECRAQVLRGEHIIDRIGDHHRVEGFSQSDRAHVSDPVRDLRVQSPGQRKHLLAYINTCDLSVFLQGVVVVASTTAQVEEGLDLNLGAVPEDPVELLGLFYVLLRRTDDGPGPGEVAVHAALVVRGRWAHCCASG